MLQSLLIFQKEPHLNEPLGIGVNEKATEFLGEKTGFNSFCMSETVADLICSLVTFTDIQTTDVSFVWPGSLFENATQRMVSFMKFIHCCIPLAKLDNSLESLIIPFCI